MKAKINLITNPQKPVHDAKYDVSLYYSLIRITHRLTIAIEIDDLE